MARSDFVLLDFDGPIARLTPPPLDNDVADQARAAVSAVELPDSIRDTRDHLTVLRWVSVHARAHLAATERAIVAAENNCARQAEISPGAAEFIARYTSSGRPIGVVTNNAVESAKLFLDRYSLRVTAVVGRVPEQPELLKPHVAPLRSAIDRLNMHGARGVMIGDSPSDVEVGHKAGLGTIGLTMEQNPPYNIGDPDAIARTLADIPIRAAD